jgi:hypothetical protein
VAGGAVAGGAVAGGAVAGVTPPERGDGAAIGAAVVVGGLDPLAAGAAGVDVGVGVVVGDTTNQVPATP